MPTETTTWWRCPCCDLMIEAAAIEQMERLRYDHIRVEHPEDLHEIEGARGLARPIHLTAAEQHLDGSWSITCCLCRAREVFADVAAFDARDESFMREHVNRHRDVLTAAAKPTPPENPFLGE